VACAFATRLKIGTPADVPRDKVFGFAFLQKARPIFSEPGDELDVAITQAIDVSGGIMIVRDMMMFNTSAKAEVLLDRLGSLGLRPDDEGRVLALAFAAGDKSLPSVDDAFAFLYNYYLKPVDDALMEAKNNFVRYRDEIYVFDDKANAVVDRELLDLGMQASKAVADTSRIKSKLIGEIEEKHKARLATPRTAVVAGEGELETSRVALDCECRGWADDDCTDGWEVKFRHTPLEATIPQLTAMMEGELDGIRVLPILRKIHTDRAAQAYRLPDDVAARQEFRAYRKAVQPLRGRLSAWIERASGRGDGWAVSWLARVLSDQGALTPAESEVLLATSTTKSLPAYAREEAAVALARSGLGSATPERIWATFSAQDEHGERAAALAASFLFRKKWHGGWLTVEPNLRTAWPELHLLLSQLHT